MKISEIFYSIQGEGIYTGLPMVFIRFQGCPFRCVWCDSQYTWDFGSGDEMPLDAVMDAVARWPARHACITGGEPLAHLRDFLALAAALKERGYWIEVETAGGHRLPIDAPVDCWVMDVKCPDSSMERINKYGEIAGLRPEDQLKFVVASRADFDFALGVLAEHRPGATSFSLPPSSRSTPPIWRSGPRTRRPRPGCRFKSTSTSGSLTGAACDSASNQSWGKAPLRVQR